MSTYSPPKLHNKQAKFCLCVMKSFELELINRDWWD